MAVVTSTQAAGRASADGLFRRYAREVFSLAYRAVGSRAEAEDVMQTTFLHAHRALRAGVEPADHRAWLLTIARNVCRSRFRALSRRPQEEPLDESLSVAGAQEGESPAQLIDALRALLPRQRAALVMQLVDGCSTAEIGARLGLGASAVDALLHRARGALRDELRAEADHVQCARTEALVQSQLRRELPGDEQAALRAHLRGCPACATAARRLRARGRVGSLLGLPWDLGNRVAGLLGQGGAAFKVAALLGSLTIGATGATQDSSQRPGGEPAPAQPPAAAGATRLQVVQADRRHRGLPADAPSIRAHHLRPGSAVALLPGRSGSEASIGAAAPAAAATTAAAPPPPTAQADAGASSTPAAVTGGTASHVAAAAGAGHVSADLSLHAGGAAADVAISSSILDAEAHVSAALSSTSVAVSTDVGTSADMHGVVEVSVSAAASGVGAVSASIGVSGAGGTTAATAGAPAPAVPPLTVPGLPGLLGS